MQRGFNVYVAALDLLKVNMWPRHWLITLFIDFCLQALDAAWTVGIFRDPKHRVDASEMSDLHRTVGIFIASYSSSDGADKTWKNLRSRCDRAAIAVLSLRNRLQTTGRRPTIDQDEDYGPIVARSRPDRAENHAFFEAKLKLVLRGIEATTHAQGSASTTLENCPHERVNWPRSSGQFLL